eukprot:scaffold217766_cov49-Attheya_sp.AAC.6
MREDATHMRSSPCEHVCIENHSFPFHHSDLLCFAWFTRIVGIPPSPCEGHSHSGLGVRNSGFPYIISPLYVMFYRYETARSNVLSMSGIALQQDFKKQLNGPQTVSLLPYGC